MSWNNLPFTDEPEQIDDPAHSHADLERSMRDVARTNALLGGTLLVVYHVSRLLRSVPRGTRVRILDVATGSADIPRALIRWGRRRGLHLTVVGVDSAPAMLRMAQSAATDVPLVRADAARLPFPPGAFDVVTCALAFHHFGFDGAVQCLRDMDKLATRGFVVSDLRRDRLTLWGVSAGLTLMRAHPFTLHDGPASVRRAFTPREYEKMAALSRVRGVRVVSHCHFRMALVQDKQGMGTT